MKNVSNQQGGVFEKSSIQPREVSSRRVVVITGSSSGIGKSTAKAFAAAGWQVVATMRNPSADAELRMIPNVDVLPLDVTNISSINAVFELVWQRFGRVDALVNNAGYGLMGPFEETSPESIAKQFETNVFGLMNVTRAALPYMRAQRFGRIVNISSIGGRLGIPLYSSYHATKFAVEGFTESLNYELKQFGIDAVLIEPGAISTEFLGRSADIAKPHEGSQYRPYFDRVYASFDEASKGGARPDVVAKKIVLVAQSKSPALRNPVGGGAEFLMAARKVLPDCAVHSLVKQQTRG